MRAVRLLPMLLLLPVAVEAQTDMSPSIETERASPSDVERASPAQAAGLRSRVIGKPVFAAGGGRVGTVDGVAIGPDGSIGAVTVAMDDAGDGRSHVPVAWPLIRAQIDNPTIILPWDAASLRWLAGQR